MCAICQGYEASHQCPCCRPEPQLPADEIDRNVERIVQLVESGHLMQHEILLEVDADLTEYADLIIELVTEHFFQKA